jgi:glycosyltransferase involved in cell wall biosynthesis
MQFPVPSETFASLDIEALFELGHQVDVKCMRFKNKIHDQLISERNHDKINISHLTLITLAKSLIFFLTNPIISLQLMIWVLRNTYKKPLHLLKSLVLFPSAIYIFKEINRCPPNVVHLFWGHYPSMVGYLVKKHLPNVTLSQFLGAHDLVSRYPPSIKLSHEVDFLITHCHDNLKLMKSLKIDYKRVNVIWRGTSLVNLKKEPLFNRKFENKIVFLTAARLIPEKGISNVISIFKEFNKKNANSILFVAGDGPIRSQLEEEASHYAKDERIIFLGHIDQIVLLKYMQVTDFFFLLSEYPSERLPNVIKEAMYQKCVVLTTRTPGIHELIDDGEDGIILHELNNEKITNSLQKILESNVRLSSITESAHTKIKNNFDVKVSMNKYIDLWESKKEKLS